ncbi:MAG TPA: hypothetical protein VGC69_15080 [Bordetella sp.]
MSNFLPGYDNNLAGFPLCSNRDASVPRVWRRPGGNMQQKKIVLGGKRRLTPKLRFLFWALGLGHELHDFSGNGNQI